MIYSLSLAATAFAGPQKFLSSAFHYAALKEHSNGGWKEGACPKLKVPQKDPEDGGLKYQPKVKFDNEEECFEFCRLEQVREQKQVLCEWTEKGRLCTQTFVYNMTEKDLLSKMEPDAIKVLCVLIGHSRVHQNWTAKMEECGENHGALCKTTPIAKGCEHKRGEGCVASCAKFSPADCTRHLFKMGFRMNTKSWWKREAVHCRTAYMKTPGGTAALGCEPRV